MFASVCCRVSDKYRLRLKISERYQRNKRVKMKRAFEDSLVVILSANDASTLENLLLNLDIPFDCVLVLDQGSTDETANICEEMGVGILQLGLPQGHMRCCRVGLDIANEKGKKFLYVVSGAVRFLTHVAHELMSEMLRDQNLAAVAPSQLIVDVSSNRTFFSSRTKWDLEAPDWGHDFTVFNPAIDRVEADFCHLSCALIRVDFLNEAGGIDDRFTSHLGDADIGYRLRMNGRSSAYLQQSQIEYFIKPTAIDAQLFPHNHTSGTDKSIFALNNLGFGAEYKDQCSTENHSWNIINKNLYPYMRRHGLIDHERPELVFSHPGADPCDYLYTVWETDTIPSVWRQHQRTYKAVCAPSRWNVDLLRDNGFDKTYYVPLGVETDVYTPFGPSQREFDCPVYLWFARNQYRKGLDVLLKVWAEFRSVHTNAVLIIMGHDVLSGMGSHRHEMRRVGKFVKLDFSSDRVYFRQVVNPLTDEEVGLVYRSVDFLVCTSRSEGFGFPIVEAMACGITPIFPNYSSLTDFVIPQSLCFGGAAVPADYADKGFDDVGNWWEPDQTELLACLKSAIQEDFSTRAERVESGLNLVRKEFTWRNTCFALRNVFAQEQVRREVVSESRTYIVPQVLDVSSELVEREKVAGANIRAHIEAGFSTEEAAAFADFNSAIYVEVNADVKESGMNGLRHFVQFGFRENRTVAPGVSSIGYLGLNGNARRCVMQRNGISKNEASAGDGN